MKKYKFEITIVEGKDEFWKLDPTVEDIGQIVEQCLLDNGLIVKSTEFVEYENVTVGKKTDFVFTAELDDSQFLTTLDNLDKRIEQTLEPLISCLKCDNTSKDLVGKCDCGIDWIQGTVSIQTPTCNNKSWQCIKCQTVYAPFISSCSCEVSKLNIG